MMNNRKAQGHIETILSFVIFVSFLVFLFAVFPVYQPEKSKVGLEASELGILGYSNVGINYSTIILNNSVSGSCFCITKPSSVTSNVIAKNSNGNGVSTSVSASLCINGNERFYQLYSSEIFSEYSFVPSGCDSVAEGDYSIGYSSSLVAVSYDKLKSLTELYSLDYASLKANLSIPERENFGFRIVNLKGEEQMPELRAIVSRPDKSEVVAKNVPIEMFYNNGTEVFFMLNIQTW